MRIATEGQYELGEEHRSELDALDDEVVAAADAGDEARFRDTFVRLLAFVRANGAKVPEEELKPSDVILPPPDVSVAEARAEFSGDGLIPS